MSATMSSLRRRAAEQDREVERLTTELKEAREEAAAAASGTAAEAALASSRQVSESPLTASRATASRRSMFLSR